MIAVFLFAITTPRTGRAGEADSVWIVRLAAPPETIFSILADPLRWPGLFPPGLVVDWVKRGPDGIDRVALSYPRPLGFGKGRLLLRLQSHSPRLLSASRISGDWERFDRVWSLEPIDGGRGTLGTLRLTVANSAWIPNFLLRRTLEHEIKVHLELLSEAVGKVSRPARPTNTANVPP